jgi:hypothetical protein
MLLRLSILAALTVVIGCADSSSPQPVPAEKPTIRLPPEVEFDPVSAIQKHRATQKALPR